MDKRHRITIDIDFNNRLVPCPAHTHTQKKKAFKLFWWLLASCHASLTHVSDVRTHGQLIIGWSGQAQSATLEGLVHFQSGEVLEDHSHL